MNDNEAAECIGNDRCPAPVHVHGCYTPHRADQCDAPNEFGHLPEAPVTRLDLDKLIAYAETVASKGVQADDGFTYEVSAASLVDSQDVIRELAAALAAERARADQAEARLNSLMPVLEMTQGTAHTVLRSVLVGGVFSSNAAPTAEHL